MYFNFRIQSKIREGNKRFISLLILKKDACLTLIEQKVDAHETDVNCVRMISSSNNSFKFASCDDFGVFQVWEYVIKTTN